jgi:hypothetical protein
LIQAFYILIFKMWGENYIAKWREDYPVRGIAALCKLRNRINESIDREIESLLREAMHNENWLSREDTSNARV